ncbi:HAD family hydrolase [Prevotella amnii]|uniref:Uncharacterized protein n=1 Tax=Prevotella amnii DNF00058 TaxID=1401066 RepID=A0A096B0B0_9BACT|nr:hypothetical protein [Prevotella amnii]KGF52401.1 hypothetical protein HMPREF9302_03740 [Prevotella amnii DNF00058]
MADINWLAEIVKVHKFHIEFYYSSITDWCLIITRKGCNKGGGDIVVFDDECNDLSLLLSKAEVAVKEYCLEELGGY